MEWIPGAISAIFNLFIILLLGFLVLSIHQLSMEEQWLKLNEQMNEWMGEWEDQIDDQTIIGIRPASFSSS